MWPLRSKPKGPTSNKNPKRMREDSKIHVIFLTPRRPEQITGKNIPPLAATEAVAGELVND